MPLLSYFLSQHADVSFFDKGRKAESNSAFQEGIRLDFPALHTGVIIDQCTELILNQSKNDKRKEKIRSELDERRGERGNLWPKRTTKK